MVKQLRDEKVQQELKLNEKQVEYANKVAELLSRIRDGKARDQAKKRLSASLTAGQLTRLKQIHWQHLGGYALLESEVSTAIGITKNQRKKLLAAEAENTSEHKKMVDFLRRARFRSREALEQFKAKYRSAANQRLRSILTREQLKSFEKLLGKPFSES
jgi:hypothetical protein